MRQEKKSNLRDTDNSYGWVSILLHWLAFAWVTALWFIGDSAGALGATEQRASQVLLHVSIALCGYALLITRIVWRLWSGHPKLEGQGKIDHLVANFAHYILLAAIALMLVTGPLIVWSGGGELRVFDWFSIASPMSANVALNQLSIKLHGLGGITILVVTFFHVCGACKHLMFDDDEIFIRMLVPKSNKK